MIKRLSTLLCFAALAAAIQFTPASAQSGTLTGTVTATETGQPIGQAYVAVRNSDGFLVASALSGQNGRYIIRAISAGQYSVTASSIGFAESAPQQAAITAGGTATVNMTLEVSPIEQERINVSTGRRPQAAERTPAHVETIGQEDMDIRAAITPVEPLRAFASVHMVTQGIQSRNVVVRGFNNIFSGALHTLTDYRLASVPSLRVNVMHFVPASADDIAAMEVVLGPGSALYGPNTANGVLHLITKDPFTVQGTTLNLTGGEQSLIQASFRTAHRLSDRFAFKVSAQYVSAEEWASQDSVEVQTSELYGSDPDLWREYLSVVNGISEAEATQWIDRVGNRTLDVRRWAAEARADWLVTDQLRTTWTVGSTFVGDAIELTGLGAAQAVDWRYTFYQLRASMGPLFGQLYLNTSDAGDTYLLRTGTPITDRSKLFGAQLQHGYDLSERQSFTYGADLFYTLPETEGTINGIYEDEDETTEIGVYLMSETSLSPQWNLTLAGRVDTHTALPDAIFSPRAGLVFNPWPDNAFRITYNRAFSTPTSLNQFLDLGTALPDPAAAALGYSVRVQGTGDHGFSFQQEDGSYLMRSPFTPTGPTTLVPAVASAYWPAAVQALVANGVLDPQSPVTALLASLAPTPADIGTNWTPIGTSISNPIDELTLGEIDPIRESTTSTIELGYQGVLGGGRHSLAVDLWYTRKKDFVTPLTLYTPFITMNGQDIGAYLVPQLVQGLGLSVQEATNLAGQLAPGLAKIPVGVVSSADVNANSAQGLATYTNVDDAIDLYGLDINAVYGLTNEFSLNGSVSLINDVVFESDEGLLVTLNSPKTQGTLGLVYRGDNGFSGEFRGRYNDEFPALSGVYRGAACIDDPALLSTDPCVEAYTLFDVTLGYSPPAMPDVAVQLNVQNLTDEDYRSYPGVPPAGRLASVRVRYEIGGR